MTAPTAREETTMESHRLTESEARNVLEAYGPAISRRLNTLYDQARSNYASDGVANPTVSVLAYNAHIIARQPIDERLMVPVGELRVGDATAVLMMGVNDGETEIVYR